MSLKKTWCRLLIVICCVLGIMGTGSITAQAAVNHTLNYFRYNNFKDDDGRNWVRIEMGMNKVTLNTRLARTPISHFS
jgi:N-acetylmuramoyl-L-alanine amidase